MFVGDSGHESGPTSDSQHDEASEDPRSTQRRTSGYDLRALFQSVGNFSGHRSLTAEPVERIPPNNPATLLDASPAEVSAEPIEVGAYLDGIQAALDVSYRGHRPVHLLYVAAGAVNHLYEPVGLREELVLTCSAIDRDWAEGLDGGVPIEVIEEEVPTELERLSLALLAGKREGLERRLTTELAEQGQTPIIVDGSLAGRPSDVELLGVVKTTRHRYLEDESCLFGLPAGWRSPRFLLPSRDGGESERCSAYVRMVPAANLPWDFGLIRVETFDPDTIDPLAARCLSERQVAASGDQRWDRHLTGVRRTEEFLRARRPWVFRGH